MLREYRRRHSPFSTAGRLTPDIKDKNNGRENSGESTLPFSASLQWLCPSTREEEEVIDSHNPNSLMVAELAANILISQKKGTGQPKKGNSSISHPLVATTVSSD
jgi:hypothetical protein